MLFALSALAAPEQLWKALEPLDPRAQPLSSFTVNPLIVRLDDDRIGATGEELRILLLEHLRALGWPVLGHENLLFGQDRSAEARYVLGGEIDGLDAIAESGATGWWLTVRWEIFDRRAGTVVYSVLTHGWLPDKGGVASALDAGEFRTLLLSALTNALARERFAAALAPPATGRGEAGAHVVAATCTASPTPLPAGIPSVLPAVVRIQQGQLMGSGVLVSADGFVWTAEHVVAGAGPVEVTTPSGLVLEASVVLRAPSADLAVLRLPGRGFPCVAADETDPALGSTLFAVGSPLGGELGGSVSRGIVSGLREADGVRLLQTDAAINPGNSGGPLFDEQGRVRGVVSTKLVGQAVEGIGFGVSAATYRAHGFEFGASSNAPLAVAPSAPAATVVDDPDPELFSTARRVCLYRRSIPGAAAEYRLGPWELTLAPGQFACVAAEENAWTLERQGEGATLRIPPPKPGETTCVGLLSRGALPTYLGGRCDELATLRPQLEEVRPVRAASPPK